MDKMIEKFNKLLFYGLRKKSYQYLPEYLITVKMNVHIYFFVSIVD